MSKRRRETEGDQDVESLSLNKDQILLLEQLNETGLPEHLKPLGPLLQQIKAIHDSRHLASHQRPLKTRQATEFDGSMAVAKDLGVDYHDSDDGHIFTLKDEKLVDQRNLSPSFADLVNQLKFNEYIQYNRPNESLSRTILDLILVDRLNQLKDEGAYNQLLLTAEVPMQVKIRGDVDCDDELVRGRADWVLGYGREKSNTGSILIIVEAKSRDKSSTGLPQLIVYMTAVYEARRDKLHRGVFGMLSDSAEFRFAYLDANKKLHVSLTLEWRYHRSQILAFLDTILLDAINSSPHTTPTKTGNTLLPNYLRGQWNFGLQEGEQEIEEEYDEGEVVDIIKTDEGIRIRNSRINYDA